MAEVFAGVQTGYADPTMRHASGQSETQDASAFNFAGEDPKGSLPTGTLTMVNYLERYMGITTFGISAEEEQKK